MTLLPPGAKVHLAFGFIDMRKGINGLAMLVQSVLRRRRETSTTASIPNRRLSVRLSGGAQSSSLLAKKDVSSAPRATGVRPRRHAGMRSVEMGCSTDGTPLVMRSPFLRYSTGKAQTLARASVLALKLCTAYPQGSRNGPRSHRESALLGPARSTPRVSVLQHTMVSSVNSYNLDSTPMQFRPNHPRPGIQEGRS
jgi:hypothetical protein